MNIIFKKIRWKNLLSTGNIFTEIDFTKDRTTLISGGNGSGKSTLLDAIVFVLYGKPFRKINKPQLINTINQKELLVELDFSIGKIDYLIRRGIKPNVFEVYKNGVLNDKTNDQQEELEQNILKMNYKSFTQVVILGSATYIPFMELQAKDRREIIEDLLDIQIFSTMNLLLKDKVSGSKEKINDNDYQIKLTTSKIDAAKENSESIKKIRDEEVLKIKAKVQENLNIIENETIAVEEVETQIDELLSSISDKDSVHSRSSKINQLISELQYKTKNLNEDLRFYDEHDNCPICRQNIDLAFKSKIINEKSTQKAEINDAAEQLSEKLEDFKKRMQEIDLKEKDLQRLRMKVGEHKTQIRISKGTLRSCKEELEIAQKEAEHIDTSKLDEYNGELKQLKANLEELYSEREVLAIVANMLKDGGIKTKIIKQYVPVMNKLINKYLAAFDLFVDFQLDENFNEVIKSRFRDTFSYSSFSEGEKLRINLAIMLTWRAVAKMRNSVVTNLLLMDETLDGALDGMGIENLIETLHHMNASDNIFVISHRGDMFGDKFDTHLKFEKVKNFSRLASIEA